VEEGDLGKGESLRLLVITELYLPTKGGSAVWFDEVYRRLGGKGIHVVTAEVPGAREHDQDHPNTVHRMKLMRRWWLRPESLGMYSKLLAKSLLLGMSNRFEAVHAGRVLPEGLVGWIVSRVFRCPLTIYAHGEEITTWRTPGKQRAMIFTYRRADHVVANSDYTRDELIRLGVQERRILLIHPGVDTDRFRPGDNELELRQSIGLAKGTKLILSVGRLSRRKGFDQVIRCLPRLLEQGLDVHYAVVGIGQDREHLEALAEGENVTGRVHLLGHRNMEELPRWYRSADVFAMPNRDIDGDNEGFGMVYLEAAASGKPCLAGRAGGTGSAVVHESTGLRVDGSSAEEVAKGLARLLSDEALARRMGEAGLLRARQQFSWEAVARTTRKHIFPQNENCSHHPPPAL
jgi:phosphatidylinositol alpha-1,6-mannosyltransferase